MHSNNLFLGVIYKQADEACIQVKNALTKHIHRTFFDIFLFVFHSPLNPTAA